MERTETKENNFPSDLEGRLGALLSVVNTEFKSLTLLHLDVGNALTKDEIRTKLKKTLNGGGYLVDRAALNGYCADIFYPMGIVAKETIFEGEVPVRTGYKLIKDGLTYGLPVTAFSLNWAVKYNQSLFSSLGSAQSNNDSRAPLNTVKVLRAIRELGDSITEASIMDYCNLSQGVVVRSLRRLDDSEMIRFESVGKNTSQRDCANFEYLPLQKEIIPVDRVNTETLKSVLAVLKREKTINYRVASDLLNHDHPHAISRMLCILERQGHAKRKDMWKGGEKMSNVRINQRGIIFLDTFVKPIESALSNPNSLEQMREEYLGSMFANTLSYQSIARKATELYAEISPVLNRRDNEERFNQIISILEKRREVTAESLGSEMGLSRCGARGLLKKMKKIKLLKTRTNKDAERVYSIRKTTVEGKQND